MLPTLLPQHQPENCAQADHIPCDLPFPDLAFKNALLKPSGEFRVFCAQVTGSPSVVL